MAHGRTAVFPTSVVALASGVSNVGSLPSTATKSTLPVRAEPPIPTVE